MNVEAILERALELPREARAMLVERLVESLDTSEHDTIRRQWVAEAHRRSDAFHAGKARTLDGPDVFARMRHSLGPK